MTILGIDYGRSNIGLSLSQSGFAEPLLYLSNHTNFLTKLIKICQEYKVNHIIIGITQGPLEEEIKAFGSQVKTQTKLPVTFHDETLSSRLTQSNLMHKSKKFRSQPQDAYQAAFILQDYLDTKTAQT